MKVYLIAISTEINGLPAHIDAKEKQRQMRNLAEQYGYGYNDLMDFTGDKLTTIKLAINYVKNLKMYSAIWIYSRKDLFHIDPFMAFKIERYCKENQVKLYYYDELYDYYMKGHYDDSTDFLP